MITNNELTLKVAYMWQPLFERLFLLCQMYWPLLVAQRHFSCREIALADGQVMAAL